MDLKIFHWWPCKFILWESRQSLQRETRFLGTFFLFNEVPYRQHSFALNEAFRGIQAAEEFQAPAPPLLPLHHIQSTKQQDSKQSLEKSQSQNKQRRRSLFSSLSCVSVRCVCVWVFGGFHFRMETVSGRKYFSASYIQSHEKETTQSYRSKVSHLKIQITRTSGPYRVTWTTTQDTLYWIIISLTDTMKLTKSM